jgi:hypothetical protein
VSLDEIKAGRIELLVEEVGGWVGGWVVGCASAGVLRALH